MLIQYTILPKNQKITEERSKPVIHIYAHILFHLDSRPLKALIDSSRKLLIIYHEIIRSTTLPLYAKSFFLENWCLVSGMLA